MAGNDAPVRQGHELLEGSQPWDGIAFRQDALEAIHKYQVAGEGNARVRHHDRNSFDRGIEALNVWLKQTALQHQAKGTSHTFVAVPFDEGMVEACRRIAYEDVGAPSILGFYALASAFVLLGDLPSALARRYPRQISLTRLGRLASRADMQGQGFGQLLLADAISRARGAAQAVGSAGIFVDAKDDAVAHFYRRYGFLPCEDQPLKLYLPLW
jgi:GNAT superfamily N-acetyltransferase